MIYTFERKSSSVDESILTFKVPSPCTQGEIGFIVDEMDDQHNMSQGSLQDLDLRPTETSEFHKNIRVPWQDYLHRWNISCKKVFLKFVSRSESCVY